MPAREAPAKLWLVTAIMAAVILYGSFYPFEFRILPHGIGPVATFLESWNARPGRGDFIANILLYLPFGFFFMLGFRSEPRMERALFVVVLASAPMSLSVELTQYYVEGRVTAVSDFYTNVLGTLLGALAARAIGASFNLPYVGEVSAQPVPTLLILAWLAYRMYPYVPTIDLHKYWNALKPIVLTPSLTGEDLFRETTIWLTLYAVIDAVIERRRSVWLAPLFAVVMLCAKVLIVNTVLRVAELAGAGVAFAVWLVLMTLPLPLRLRAAIVGIVLCVYVIVLRLEPFAFQAFARPFDWIPFFGLMHGSLQVDALAFLEKFFLYGSMLFLLGEALGRRLPAAIFVAVLLFSTSWAELYLPDRSGEITDALMSVMIAVVFALLPTGLGAPGPAAVPRLSSRERQLREWQRAQARSMGVKLE
ncbi:MAG TPA: VanZ family protein [Acetobacteraceae bacterium]|nr:VanZ family protein [Acetobacteraceae bacterium]